MRVSRDLLGAGESFVAKVYALQGDVGRRRMNIGDDCVLEIRARCIRRRAIESIEP